MKYNKNKKLISQITIVGMLSTVVIFSATPVFASQINKENVLFLLNHERIYYGLSPLKDDTELDSAATMKSKDMSNRNYFEHYAYGLTPWDFIHNAGYNYLYAGENLAMNFDTAEGMVNAWMDSPAHRANILNPDYTDTGLGIVKGATYSSAANEPVIVTNMFGRKKPAIVEAFNKVIENIAYLFSWR